MYIEQLYTNCLAEAAYYIESDGEVAIIDPIRDTEAYIKKAEERNAKIKYIFETHFHADFISGHLDLAAKTGAEIIFGPAAETKYKVLNAKDGEQFSIGKITIKVMHTPGHTPESACFLLKDESGKDHAVFTGDTLFVGDVGRPDLLDGKMTKEELASMMYDSLNQKLLPLADDVIVYPAHGPGSACGKNIGKETWSTMGEQKKKNYALQNQTREEFILKVTDGLSAPPAYFFSDARINKEGYTALDKIVTESLKALSPEEFAHIMNSGATILDTRTPDQFEKGFIPGSVNIGLNGTFAVFAGSLIDINKELLLVCDEGKEHESVIRLARVGYENVRGFLKGGLNSWTAAGMKLDSVESIDPSEFASFNTGKGYRILDVRKPGELDNGYFQGAINIPLQEIFKAENEIDRNEKLLIHCAGGYRSMIAVSLLKNAGFKNLVNVKGGYAKIKEHGIPVVNSAINQA
jgi:hydroxyacylglutathione hydrolase